MSLKTAAKETSAVTAKKCRKKRKTERNATPDERAVLLLFSV